MKLSDSQFIEQIETLKLDPEQFSHVGHLRLCWLYLDGSDIESAILKTCETIKAYAESLGAATKFSRTVTESLVKIISQRMNSENNWEAFVENNHDLRDDCLSVLHTYYSRDLLVSEKARLTFVEPDLKPL